MSELKIKQLAANGPDPNDLGSLEATSMPNKHEIRALADRLATKGGPAEELASAGAVLKQLEGRHRAAALAQAIRIYAVAMYLRESTDSWTDFCLQPEWSTFRGKKPSPETQSDALRFALRFAYGFDDPAATKRASKDASMLQSAFTRRLTPALAAKEVNDAGGKEAYSQLQQRSRGLGDVNAEDVIIRLVAGNHLERLLSVRSGQKAKLVIVVQCVEGRVLMAKARSVLRIKKKI